MGIGGVLSSDGGKTWSPEFPIRKDGAGSDQGYPVACQFEDGRVFVAYYYLMPDGNKFDGTRYMAASTFRTVWTPPRTRSPYGSSAYSQCSATFLLGCTRGGSPGIFG